MIIIIIINLPFIALIKPVRHEISLRKRPACAEEKRRYHTAVHLRLLK